MPGEHERVGAHHVVVLPIDPALARDRRRRRAVAGTRPRARRGDSARRVESSHLVEIRRPRRRAVVDRRLVDERACSGSRRPPRRDPSRAAARRRSRRRCARRADPTSRRSLRPRPRALLDDEQHALLRFGQHDLVRRHAGLALRHAADVDLDAGCRRARPSRRSSRSGRPRPCPGRRSSASVCISSRHASSSSFSMNGSPTCTAGRFSADFSSNSADAIVAP